jgi:hypothetical protein
VREQYQRANEVLAETEQPSPAVRAAVLAAAARQVHARPQPVGLRAPRWRVPLAAAASLLVGLLAVVLASRYDEPLPQTVVKNEAAAPEAARSASGQSNAAAPTVTQSAAPSAAPSAAQSAPQIAQQTEQRDEQQRRAPPTAAPSAPAPLAQTESVQAAPMQRTQPALPAPPAPSSPALATAAAAPAARASNLAPAPAERSASDAASGAAPRASPNALASESRRDELASADGAITASRAVPPTPPAVLAQRSQRGKDEAQGERQVAAQRAAPAPAAPAPSAPPASASPSAFPSSPPPTAGSNDMTSERRAVPGATAVPAEQQVKARPVQRTAPVGDGAAPAALSAEEAARSITRIVELRRAGRDAEADAALKALRERAPNLAIPPEALPRTGTR